MIHSHPSFFFSNGVPLVGRFYRNTQNLFTRQPAVIVTGSWLTVKEQMATVYAERLAERGYTAFTFDFAGFGESGGGAGRAGKTWRENNTEDPETKFLSRKSFCSRDGPSHFSTF